MSSPDNNIVLYVVLSLRRGVDCADQEDQHCPPKHLRVLEPERALFPKQSTFTDDPLQPLLDKATSQWTEWLHNTLAATLQCSAIVT